MRADGDLVGVRIADEEARALAAIDQTADLIVSRLPAR